MIYLLLSGLLSFGQVQCDPDNALHCAAPIQKGESSPLTGQVLTDQLVIDLGQAKEQAEKDLEIEKSRLEKRHKVDIDLERKLARVDLQVATSSATIQKQRADYWQQKAEEDPPLITHPVILVVATSVWCLLMVFALSSFQN